MGDICQDELYYLVKEKNEDAERILCSEVNRYLRFLSYTKTNSFLRSEDVFSYGWQGYMEALEAYRPEGTVGFKSFSQHCINRRLVDVQRRRNKQSLRPLMAGLSLSEARVEYIVDAKNKSTPNDNRLQFREFWVNLSAFEKLVFQLSVINGAKIKEIAEQFDVSPQKVYKVMREVKDKYKNIITGG